MLRRTRRLLHLMPSVAMLAQQRGRGAPVSVRQVALPGGLHDLPGVLAEWAGPKKTLTVSEILVDDHWCRLFMVRTPANASRHSDLAFAAAARFETLYDEPPDAWRIEADWSVARPFLACAMHAPLLDAIEASPVRVSHVVPRSVDLFASHQGAFQKQRGWIIACGETRIAMAACGRDGLSGVHQTPLSADFWEQPSAFARLLEQASVRLNEPVPEAVALCGAVPEAWTPAYAAGLNVAIHRDAAPVERAA